MREKSTKFTCKNSFCCCQVLSLLNWLQLQLSVVWASSMGHTVGQTWLCNVEMKTNPRRNWTSKLRPQTHWFVGPWEKWSILLNKWPLQQLVTKQNCNHHILCLNLDHLIMLLDEQNIPDWQWCCCCCLQVWTGLACVACWATVFTSTLHHLWLDKSGVGRTTTWSVEVPHWSL